MRIEAKTACKRRPCERQRVGSLLAVFLCLFAVTFFLSQSISVWHSVQARQVEAESFKIERESSRKEFSKDSFDFSPLALLSGAFKLVAVKTVYGSFFPSSPNQGLRSGILIASASAPRAPPL